MLFTFKRANIAGLIMLTLVAFMSSAFYAPTQASESLQKTTFYRYIKDLYYANHCNQISKYWIKNVRVPLNELMGTADQSRLRELKSGYCVNPRITVEVVDGNTTTMKGTGLAYSQGYRCQAQLDVIMKFEEGSWKIQYYTWQGSIPGHY